MKRPLELLRPKGRSLVSFVTNIRCRDNRHPVRLGSIPVGELPATGVVNYGPWLE